MTIYPGVEQGEVEADGTTVRFYDSGRGAPGRPPLVLLHGTGGSAQASFWALYPMLAFEHRVITFDFATELGAEPLTLDRLVGQARAVIKQRTETPVAVLGYSLGAVVAAKLAAEHPRLLDTLVLVAGWAKTDAQQRLRNRVWRLLYESQHPSLPEFMAFTAHSQPFLTARTAEEVDQIVEKLRTGPDRSALMRLNREIDIGSCLPYIRARTLVVGATFDQMVPIQHSRLLFGGIADARFAEIPAGHAVVHERPAELFWLLHTFLTDPHAHPAGAVIAGQHT